MELQRTPGGHVTFSESTETIVPVFELHPTGYIEPKQWYTLGIPSRWALLGFNLVLAAFAITSLGMGSVLYNKLCESLSAKDNLSHADLVGDIDFGVTDFQKVAIIMHLFVYSVLVFFCAFG